MTDVVIGKLEHLADLDRKRGGLRCYILVVEREEVGNFMKIAKELYNAGRLTEKALVGYELICKNNVRILYSQ